MLLIAARYYELPQWNNNLKSLGSDTVPVQVRLAAFKRAVFSGGSFCKVYSRSADVIALYIRLCSRRSGGNADCFFSPQTSFQL